MEACGNACVYEQCRGREQLDTEVYLNVKIERSFPAFVMMTWYDEWCEMLFHCVCECDIGIENQISLSAKDEMFWSYFIVHQEDAWK